MLSNIIKQSDGWDTKALAKIFSNKKFLKSVDGDKEKYLADLISKDYEKRNITLPREIIPNDVTLSALCYIYKKEPATLPILLRYFTHSNLLAEAKDDLDKLNQKLQGVMDKDLKDLQDKKAKLQADKTNFNSKEVHSNHMKNAIDEINKQITKTSSKIKKLELYKEDIKNFLNGDKVKLMSYPPQYFSILNSGLIEIMEKKLTAYVKDNTDIEETYSSLNSRAKRIASEITMIDSEFILMCIMVMSFPLLLCGVLGETVILMIILFIPIILVIVTSVVGFLIEIYREHSFAKEMQDFIEKPKYVDKATNTEDVKKLEREETGVGDLIDLSGNYEMNYKVEPSAPPYDEPKQPGLYPDLSKEDLQPSSNFYSVLPPSNTVRGVI